MLLFIKDAYVTDYIIYKSSCARGILHVRASLVCVPWN